MYDEIIVERENKPPKRERRSKMASVHYNNGSWYVLYAEGRAALCHNRCTAVYLAREANDYKARLKSYNK